MANKKSEPWYMKEPEGTLEEKREAFNIVQQYTYKLLDYADKEEAIPKEVIDKERRIFSFARQGPRAGHFTHSQRSKLTSADVLYILTNTSPSYRLGDKFDVDPRKIRQIRSGDRKEWEFEYKLIKRLKAIIRGELMRPNQEGPNGRIYSLSKLGVNSSYEILYYTTSFRKANALRKSIITEDRYLELTEEGTLDIIYPISRIGVV